MFRRILVANDGSDGGFKAFAAGLELAQRDGAELHMITVEDLRNVHAATESAREEGDASPRSRPVIERAKLLARFKGLELHEHLVRGHPVPTITEFARTHDFDLLVIGFMGHAALYNRLVGSTTHRVVRLSPCPVLVAK